MIGAAVTAMGVAARLTASVAVIPGLLPTQYDYTPSYQWHFHTATLTMAPSQTITASMTLQTGGKAGNVGKMSVTANNGFPIVVGDTITLGSYTGKVVVVAGQIGGGNGNDWALTGTDFYVLPAPSGAIASTTGTVQNSLVLGFTDALGNTASMSGTFDGTNMPGLLVFDKFGRKMLKTLMNNNVLLYTVTSASAMDTANMTWIMTGSTRGKSGVIVQCTGQTPQLEIRNNYVGMGTNTINSTTQANLNRLFVGEQMQVLCASSATTDGFMGSASTTTVLASVNESFYSPGSNETRSKTATVFKLFGGSHTIYELTGFVSGQMGTAAQMPTRRSAQIAKAQANYAIPTITDNFIAMGDSRSVNNTYALGNLATAIAESFTLPASWRVFSGGNSGKGIPWMQIALAAGKSANLANAARPYNSDMMFGGGHDRMTVFFGINGLSGAAWLNSTIASGGGAGGNFPQNSVALANEMYGDPANGMTPVYTSTFTVASGAPNSITVTTSANSGGYLANMPLSGTGIDPGISLEGYSGGTLTFNRYNIGTPSGVLTGTLYSFLQNVKIAYDLGWKITVAAEIDWSGSVEVGRLAYKSKVLGIVSDLSTLLGVSQATVAQKVNVCDLSAIVVNGRLAWDFQASGGGDYYDGLHRDGTHQLPAGSFTMWTGSDTPANGLAQNVLALT